MRCRLHAAFAQSNQAVHVVSQQYCMAKIHGVVEIIGSLLPYTIDGWNCQGFRHGALFLSDSLLLLRQNSSEKKCSFSYILLFLVHIEKDIRPVGCTSLVPMPRRARRHANTNSRPKVFCCSKIELTKRKTFPVNSAHASAYQTGSTVEPVLSVGSQAFNHALRPSTPAIPMAWNLSHVVGLLLAISLTIVGCGIFWLTNALKPLLKVRLKAFDSASQMYTSKKLTGFIRIILSTILH